MKNVLRAWLGVACCVAPTIGAGATACKAPANGTVVAVPGKPFGIAFSHDGCWMFVSMMTGRRRGAVAVLRDSGGAFDLTRVIALADLGTDDSLTHDGSLLIVPEWDDTAVFRVRVLEQPTGIARVGTLRDGHRPGMVYAATSLDDGLLFVSDETARRISVFDLAKWRAGGFTGNALVGDIPTGIAPVGLALSPDGARLYATSEESWPPRDFDNSCRPESDRERWHPPGLLLSIDVKKAATDPRGSLTGGMQAGCNPVRVAASPDGAYVWVTARDSNAVLRIPVGAASWRHRVTVTSFSVGGGPVGIAVRPDGKQVWVALANRFKATKYNPEGREIVGLLGTDQSDTSSVGAVSEPASAFPRQLAFLPDGHTFAVGLFDADRIEFFATLP